MKEQTGKANKSHWTRVFSPENVAHRTIEPGSHYKTLPGWFPSSKSVRGQLRTREPLMRDFLFHLDTDPAVTAIAEFPERVSLVQVDSRGRERSYEHVPDLAALTSSGAVFVFDIIPFYVQQELRWLPARNAILKEHYAGKQAHYHVLDERTIHLRPLFDNLVDMWKQKPVAGQHPAIDLIARQILARPLPLRIGDLMRCATPNAMFGQWEGDAEATMIGEVNPVYTAVMQLAMAGKVEVDLGRRFSQFTLVCFPGQTEVIRTRPQRAA
ncbi:hypothetical protein [Rhizobium leguminosarum]|uniref:hypothetical protein n=1 Tax=Rhizobium leguminosarum TaxID=384 RepID=UPI001C984FDD|nr:hypothetical protein [Rhizobium leguminosarum]MBY5511867.1 hypothetical protein [Rhizobium leguminosarum]